MAGKGSGRIEFKIITISIWVATLSATAPVIYYTDIVTVGHDRTEMCKLTWISNTREECEIILTSLNNVTCQVNTETCGMKPTLSIEKGYWIGLMVMFIVIPICITIGAYYAIIYYLKGEV